ncbi:ATP-dependent helicase [Campylobacter troglodytis]|uniref:ATP-dependent helicase n=1 Tax=Campylobacter troglodytis TaxID=654363 RepID=UPI0011587CAB|nr:ATP-dependent helicase [Campylobacter troglodytis]TQR54784.1 ATP-dependent DNA helicase [Campylobacter troglodytis]
MPLSRLNKEQHSAATAELGHNLIIASAGTGKTSTIVARIAYLLKSGVDPQKIMLLTFTNKASKEMIDRLNAHFDKKLTRHIIAGTFHSTAYGLLRSFNKNIILKPIKELKSLLKSVYEKRTFHHLSELTPFTPSYLYDTYSLFRNLNEDNFIEYFVKKHKEQGVYVEIYEDILREWEEEKDRFNYVDFNDLLIKLKAELANRELEFAEILVDEYQDTNALQGSLIEAFKSKSLFCVGDYDQSIYAFNGADIGIIGSFKDRFKNAKIHTLTQNYRSSKSILALANKVILNNERLYPKELIVTRMGEFAPPQLLSFNENLEQYAHIAKLVRDSGVSAENIAVIFRNNSSADGIELALKEVGIASVRKESVSFFDSLEVRAFCAMLALIINPKDLMAFMNLLEHSPGIGSTFSKELFDSFLRLGHDDLIRGFLDPDKTVNLQKSRKKNHQLGLFNDLELLSSSSRFKLQSEFNSHPILALSKLNEMGARNLERLYFFIKEANKLRTLSELIECVLKNEYFKEICDLLATKRAINRATLKVDLQRKEESLEKISRKIELLKELSKDYSDPNKYYNFLTLGANELSSGKGVNLLSIHASKGLEFELVFIIDLAQDRFPNKKLMAMGGSLEEERRLFYVAVTRAKNTLYLSYARYDRIKKMNYKPSIFLIEAGLCKE